MSHLVIDALRFPHERHERRSDPGPFSRYQSYKPHLQREFHRKCVYCRVADWKGYDLVLSALGLFLTSRHELLRDLAALEATPPAKAGTWLADDLRETSAALDRVNRLIEALTGEPSGV